MFSFPEPLLSRFLTNKETTFPQGFSHPQLKQSLFQPLIQWEGLRRSRGRSRPGLSVPGPQDFVPAAAWGLPAAADDRLRGAVTHAGHRPAGADPHWPDRPGQAPERGRPRGVGCAGVLTWREGGRWSLTVPNSRRAGTGRARSFSKCSSASPSKGPCRTGQFAAPNSAGPWSLAGGRTSLVLNKRKKGGHRLSVRLKCRAPPLGANKPRPLVRSFGKCSL